ncbi:sigma-70 family RNA polymerase sigma factor [Singulisphaera sp. Ch08]|uniref:Sigma-70 family RNA polymerase sigma factor n=1 Tax=Singulisphaera sp. Ch08 TaxID=3120278 RepID=A0AAU7CCP2_9BACT
MAFAALVERHGPMVLRVCRKVLRHSHDASDAFQATFLVLARKAGSIYCRDTLGPYLHAVALRVASCTHSAVARRRRHERGYAERAETTYVGKPPDDLGRVLHEELGRLPERFRGVAVLCDLEGMTYVEAAGRLGCPPGTVMSRLAEARRRLRVRLARRGLAPSIGVIAATLAAEAKATVLPLAMAEATIQAAMRYAAGQVTTEAVVSVSVTALTEGVLKAMLLTKLKSLALIGLVGGAVSTGAGVLAQGLEPRTAGVSIAQSQSPNISTLSGDRLQSLEKTEEQSLKFEERVTDLAVISTSSQNNLRLEGVGLVVGLDGTGAKPPSSWHRDRLLDEMKKAGIEYPETLLANPSLSIVIARLTIPTGTSKADHLNVELELPPACETTSLAGGYLIECRLKQVADAGGTLKEGQELARARGPVLIGTKARPNDPKVGRVLGGARVKKDFPHRLELKVNRKSVERSQLLQNVVNQRFHQTEGLKQNGMATAETDGFLELRVPQVYKRNQYRYLRVIKRLPLVDSPQLRHSRLVTWGEELLDPTKAEIAALKLEGLGGTAIDTLKRGLASPNDQVKFFAAEALAYLNDASGVGILCENAIKRPEFCAFALAALSATD